MSKLCEGCPLRGDMTGDIIATTKRSDITTEITKNWGFEFGAAGALVDVDGHISEVLDFNASPSEISTATLSTRIDQCTEPTERTGFFDKILRKKPTCSALGHLAISSKTGITPGVALGIRDVLKSDGIHARNTALLQRRGSWPYWFKA